jgi:hypothetical protein
MSMADPSLTELAEAKTVAALGVRVYAIDRLLHFT